MKAEVQCAKTSPMQACYSSRRAWNQIVQNWQAPSGWAQCMSRVTSRRLCAVFQMKVMNEKCGRRTRV